LLVDRKVRTSQADKMVKKIVVELVSPLPVHSRPQTFMSGRATVSKRPGRLPFSFTTNLQSRVGFGSVVAVKL
jgi:hypothetical protein